MDKDDMFKDTIDAIKRHLSGEKKMTIEELQMMEADLEIDSPYSDDWRYHGYSSYGEWFADHKDYLEKLDEVFNLFRSIPEVKQMHEMWQKEYESKIKHALPLDDSFDILTDLGI